MYALLFTPQKWYPAFTLEQIVTLQPVWEDFNVPDDWEKFWSVIIEQLMGGLYQKIT